MSDMLRHVPTGDLYIFTETLAARADMELIPSAPVEVATPEPVKPKAQRAKAIKITPAPVFTPLVFPSSDEEE
jgi:hypothetical protein